MSRPQFEVADIIRSAGADFIERNRSWLRWTHLKVLLAIARCRTAVLGGHSHSRCRKTGFLEGPMQSDSHLGFRSQPLDGVAGNGNTG